jgi:hypothetical protein
MRQTLIYNSYYNENYIVCEITDLLQVVKINIVEKNNNYYIYYKLKHFEEKKLPYSYSNSFTKEEVIEDVLNGLLYKMEKGTIKNYSVWIKKE